jgi:hypothetical protein
MVMRMLLRIAALLLCAAPGLAAAAVIATIDRNDVELNESFTLDVTVDTAIDVEPDVSVLEKDFYVLSRSELRNTTIVNGQISRTRTWTYTLMAKQAGNFVIPPIVVGNEQSQPVPITIAPVREVQPGESDVFVVTEVDYPKTWVQAQVLYRIKVYRAVPTRQALLYEPDINGVDVLVELAAEDRTYDSIIQGKNYEVVERVYALFPQASGELSIAPARFEARVLRDGRITGRKIFKSDAIDIEVQPIPPPPPEHPTAAWFPAKSVQISEEWSRDPVDLPAGEPVTRRVSIEAVGQLSTQIPVLQPAGADGVKIYPDKPELAVAAVADGIRATRRDQYAIIAVDPGEVRLPPVELPWWDIREERWRIASLPERTLTIAPSADALPAQHAAGAEPESPAETETAAAPVPASPAWRNLSVALACLWLATVLAWWRSRRAAQASQEPAADTVPTSRLLNSQLRLARNAAERGDARETKAALLKWARLQWPERPPRSIGELAARVPGEIREELLRLSSSSYGPERVPWDGAALARALRGLRLDDDARHRRPAQGLPPLMPSA